MQPPQLGKVVFTPVTFNQVCEVLDNERKLPIDCSDLINADADTLKRELARVRTLLHSADGASLKELARKMKTPKTVGAFAARWSKPPFSFERSRQGRFDEAKPRRGSSRT